MTSCMGGPKPNAEYLREHFATELAWRRWNAAKAGRPAGGPHKEGYVEVTACMGGWCTKRDHCANYHADDRSNPVERLCEPGADVHTPIRVYPTTRPAPTPEIAAIPTERMRR